MKQLWTAQVHLLTPPASFGDTRCLTNVVAWADGAEEFTETVAKILGRRDWSVIDVRQLQRTIDCRVTKQELAEQINSAARERDSCIFGTLHYYPSRTA